jgi:hypothetical protein
LFNHFKGTAAANPTLEDVKCWDDLDRSSPYVNHAWVQPEVKEKPEKWRENAVVSLPFPMILELSLKL